MKADRGLPEAVNHQNPLKPNVRRLPITTTIRPVRPLRRGNRPAGQSPVTRCLTNSEAGEPQDLWNADAQLMGARQGRRGDSTSAIGKACKDRQPDSMGVVSAPKADKEQRWTWEPARVPLPSGTDGRSDRRTRAASGSPHSSPRTGKPSAWRRRAVDATASRMDNLSDRVNTECILDMRRRLYRWSAADSDRGSRICSTSNAIAKRCFALGNGWPPI